MYLRVFGQSLVDTLRARHGAPASPILARPACRSLGQAAKMVHKLTAALSADETLAFVHSKIVDGDASICQAQPNQS